MAQYEVTLRDYWRILRRRKGIVVFTALILGAFSFVVSSVWQPIPIFRAAARLQINPAAGDGGNAFWAEYGGGGFDIETQMAVLTSFKVMERVATKLGFLEFATTSEDTARVVSLPGRLDTQQQGNTNIITLSVTDRDPVMA